MAALWHFDLLTSSPYTTLVLSTHMLALRILNLRAKIASSAASSSSAASAKTISSFSFTYSWTTLCTLYLNLRRPGTGAVRVRTPGGRVLFVLFDSWVGKAGVWVVFYAFIPGARCVVGCVGGSVKAVIVTASLLFKTYDKSKGAYSHTARRGKGARGIVKHSSVGIGSKQVAPRIL